MPRTVSLCSSLALLAAPIVAGAQVLGFSAADPTFGDTHTTFARGAYTIEFTPGPPSAFGEFTVGNPAGCLPACTSNGQYNIYVINEASLTLSGGPSGGFTLRSIDAATFFTTIDAPLDLLVTGQLVGGGTVSTRIQTAPGAADVFRTFLLPDAFAGLASVQLASMPVLTNTTPIPQRLFALNDFTVAPTLATPEPTSLALVAGGAMLVGAAAGRRRTRGGIRTG